MTENHKNKKNKKKPQYFQPKIPIRQVFYARRMSPS